MWGAAALKPFGPALLFLFCISSGDLRRAQSPAPSQDAGSAQPPAEAASQPPPIVAASFEINGIVRAGETPLPGVTVTASNSLTGKKFAVATMANGKGTLGGLPRGRSAVRTEF